MSTTTLSVTLAAAMFALAAAAVPAQALPSRTFVSGSGVDAGTCARSAPCRSFAFALTQTAPNGEIDVLDSAGYGALIIDQAVSIVAPAGVEASVSAASGATAITVAAGPNDDVRLSGLTLDGGAIASMGIVFNSGGSLEIVDCVARHFTGNGILLQPSTASTFTVQSTNASNNGAGGIFVSPSGSGSVTGLISGATTNNDNEGLVVVGTFSTASKVAVTVVDSASAHNVVLGYYAVAAAGHAPAALTLRNVAASNNGTGIQAGGLGVVRLGHSVVAANTTGANSGTGTIFSFGDNDFSGNGLDVSGSLTPVVPR